MSAHDDSTGQADLPGSAPAGRATRAAPPPPVAVTAPALTDSIAARLLRIIFGCYFLVTVVVTCIQLAAEYRHTEERLLQDIAAMQQTFGPGITDAMWRYNDEVLRGILSGVKELPIVIGVKVLDAQGKLVRAAGTVHDEQGRRLMADANGVLAPVQARKGLFDQMLERSFPIVYVDENRRSHAIGRWTVYSNQQVIVKQVEYGFFLILVNSIIKTLALWFILFVVRRWLGRPLQFEATRRLRSQPATARLPVLAVSANVSTTDEAMARAAGADAFLQKPIVFDQLLQQVGELLRLRWILAQPVAASEPASRLVAPPRDEIEILYRLARLGNMRSIRDRADHVGGLDTRYRAFADRLRTLADRFESKAIVELINGYREEG